MKWYVARCIVLLCPLSASVFANSFPTQQSQYEKVVVRKNCGTCGGRVSNDARPGQSD